MSELIQLIKTDKIKAYIVSARYESLRSDFDSWMKKIDPNHCFAGYFYNNKNEQPHLFKEKMIKKLDLDIFIEDNWDIVAHLGDKLKVKSEKFKIFWIYNILDRNIRYQYKYPSLKKVVEAIKLEL